MGIEMLYEPLMSTPYREFSTLWEPDKIAQELERVFPGEGWRLPTLEEAAIIRGLVELGVGPLIASAGPEGKKIWISDQLNGEPTVLECHRRYGGSEYMCSFRPIRDFRWENAEVLPVRNI